MTIVNSYGKMDDFCDFDICMILFPAACVTGTT